MRISRRSLGRVGDFVPGWFALPQNPVCGMGDFVSGTFTLPQNPIRDAMGMGFVSASFALPENVVGMGDCGCGCGGSCNGMGDIDLSFDGTGIGDSLGANGAVPNWAVYLSLGGAALYAYTQKKGGRRR